MSRRLRIQSWDESLHLGQLGVELAVSLLESKRLPNEWYQTLLIRSVEADVECQCLGIDLLWGVSAATCTAFITVEVKADRNHNTGNFFFETVSDTDRMTPGAFVSSRAEQYFYTFPDIAEIYCLPLYDTRDWFYEHLAEFPERAAHSTRGGRSWNESAAPDRA